MRKIILEFLRRGLTACGLGPIVLAVIYFVLQQFSAVQTLTVNQVCIGIFSLAALAFIAGGMNVLYKIEQIPLMVAISIHCCVLYVAYLLTYLVNGWLELGILPIMVFTAIFIVGFLAIWAVIYSIIKKDTAKINESLKKKQKQ